MKTPTMFFKVTFQNSRRTVSCNFDRRVAAINAAAEFRAVDRNNRATVACISLLDVFSH